MQGPGILNHRPRAFPHRHSTWVHVYEIQVYGIPVQLYNQNSESMNEIIGETACSQNSGRAAAARAAPRGLPAPGTVERAARGPHVLPVGPCDSGTFFRGVHARRAMLKSRYNAGSTAG